MDTDKLKNLADMSNAADENAPDESGAAGFAYENPVPGGDPLSRAPAEERGGANAVVREVVYEKPPGGAQGIAEIRVKFEPLRIVVSFDAASAQRRIAGEVARAADEIRAAVDGIVRNAIAGLDRRASVRGTV
jgi:hypothetical protein